MFCNISRSPVRFEIRSSRKRPRDILVPGLIQPRGIRRRNCTCIGPRSCPRTDDFFVCQYRSIEKREFLHRAQGLARRVPLEYQLVDKSLARVSMNI